MLFGYRMADLKLVYKSLDAYFGGKVKSIWSEKIFTKGQNFEEKISSLISILWSSSYDLS